jgi:hypothetical protein
MLIRRKYDTIQKILVEKKCRCTARSAEKKNTCPVMTILAMTGCSIPVTNTGAAAGQPSGLPRMVSVSISSDAIFRNFCLSLFSLLLFCKQPAIFTLSARPRNRFNTMRQLKEK